MTRLLLICLVAAIFLGSTAAYGAAKSNTAEIEKIILDTINKNRTEKIQADKKLSALAAYLGEDMAAPNVITANKYGVYDMAFETASIQSSDKEFFHNKDLFAGLNRSTVVGISVTEKDGVYHATVIGAKRYVELSKINPKITSNTTEIRGKWLDKGSTPSNITVAAPDGSAISYDIEAMVKNHEFKVSINTPAQGKYICEINAKSAQGPLSGATILLFKNIEPDYSNSLGDKTKNSVVYWLQLINEEREKQGLNKLVLSRKLSEIAQSHSADMATNDYIAHVSPTTGNVQDRVKGVNYTALGENVALGGSVAEIHNGLMNSPAHRKNIMGDYTAVGLGLYKKGDSYYANQIFIK